MSVGIHAFGGYVPRRRLQREVIAATNAWFNPGLKGLGKGERSIANWDEDAVTMAVEAGLSLPGALQQATQNGPDGLLKKEIQRVNRDIKAGAGRIEALEALAERLNLREVTGVVAALAQADRSGGSVGETLRIQADQQRVERFQRAEKLAMEAPVKLIFPLVAFIFPTTFLVLAFPILMKLLHDV